LVRAGTLEKLASRRSDFEHDLAQTVTVFYLSVGVRDPLQWKSRFDGQLELVRREQAG
jgi:hypothetical protein